MAPRATPTRKLGWWLAMVSLFLVSLVVLSQRENLKNGSGVVFPAVPEVDLKVDEARIAREKKIEMALESWREKLELLKGEIKSSRVLSSRRSYLKKLLRELKADERLVKKELRDLRMASEQEWEHLADHVDADLAKMQESYEGRHLD